MANIRLTKPTIAVLETLISATDDAPAWGLSICRDADLGPGTVYPAPHPGRPARRFYELTGTGRLQANQALEARRVRRLGLGLLGGAS